VDRFRKPRRTAPLALLLGCALIVFGCGRSPAPSATPQTVEVTVTETVATTITPTPEPVASETESPQQAEDPWAAAPTPLAEDPWSAPPATASPSAEWGIPGAPTATPSPGTPTPSPEQPAELRIENFRFSHKKGAPSEPIRAGEPVWANFDVTGMRVEDGRISLHAWWRVKDASGRTLKQFDLRNAEKPWTTGRPFDAYIRIHNKIPAGDYVFAFRILDNFTGRSVVRRAPLTVK